MIYNDLHTNHKDSLKISGGIIVYFPLTFSRFISPTFFSDTKPASMTPEVWMLTASKRHHRRYKVASTQQWNRLHEAACFNRNHQVRGNRKISNKKTKNSVTRPNSVLDKWHEWHGDELDFMPKPQKNETTNFETKTLKVNQLSNGKSPCSIWKYIFKS